MTTVLLRLFDIFISVLGLFLVMPLMLLITLVSMTDTGRPVFLQERVGRNKEPFTIVKFPTMARNTLLCPHIWRALMAPRRWAVFYDGRSSDELPQLWNVLKGEMSLVGPRPGLLNQPDLTAAREKLDVFAVRPGITGLAQINGIDMSTPELLAQTDARMISRNVNSQLF